MPTSTPLDTLDPDAPLALRHLWLIGALRWVRGEEADVQASVGRVRLFLDTVQGDPAVQARWRRWWGRFIATVDLTPLLADHGFAPRTAFLSEFGNRLRKKVLPGTPETTDMAELFDLLLSARFDVRWLKALDSDTLKRLRSLLIAAPADEAPAADSPTGFWQT
ncbi:MAG: recombinase, partial [Hydrogenophaga sp.]|nr:recombinase [Hydrogenophaga sp.]